MGRKIPGKKHRTIKDPYRQKQKRLESVRLKVDNPPSNADEQEMPKSLLEIIQLKNKTKQSVAKKDNFLKNKKPNSRKRKKTNSETCKKPVVLSVAKLLDKEPTIEGLTKPDVFIPNLVQMPNETVQSFLGRVSSMTQNLINEVEFEKKFGVEIKKNSETGEIMEVKKIRSKKSRNKNKKLAEKRKTKLNMKKENLKNIKDFSQLKDNIEFGEVVHRPPDFSKMKKLECKIQKPKFSNLLLNSVTESSHIKPKNLQNNFEKEKKENERKFIIDAYRKLRRKFNEFSYGKEL